MEANNELFLYIGIAVYLLGLIGYPFYLGIIDPHELLDCEVVVATILWPVVLPIMLLVESIRYTYKNFIYLSPRTLGALLRIYLEKRAEDKKALRQAVAAKLDKMFEEAR